jgi:lipopolysaccharide/colanic/teichoic acid biosynthesis glycosyltransferase
LGRERGIEFTHQVYEYPLCGGDSADQGDAWPRETVAVQQDEREIKPLLFCRSLPLWKRMVDVTVAVLGLILLAPLLAAVAVLVKCTSRGPIFFAQVREGLAGKRFTMYKFRTMRADAEALKEGLRHLSEQDGPAFKIENDPRLTVIGKMLRKTCIDELPQLINVLRGEMTLVGPRPLPLNESRACARWQRRRLEVLPGLTCFWQIEGNRKTPFVEWMRMDIRYIRKIDFWTDARLVLRTIWVVFIRRNSV